MAGKGESALNPAKYKDVPVMPVSLEPWGHRPWPFPPSSNYPQRKTQLSLQAEHIIPSGRL